MSSKRKMMAGTSLDLCGLCSAERNLIGMFSGKDHSIRENLRRIIKDTLCIEIQPKDGYPQTVCYNCLVEVSNFYLFKSYCKLNVKKPELNNIESPRKKLKTDVIPVAEIASPDYASTVKIMNWLKQKRAFILEHLDNKFEKSPKMQNKSSQTFEVMGHKHETIKDKDNQTLNRCLDKNKGSRTRKESLKDVDVQCEIVEVISQSCQTIKVRPLQKSCQTDITKRVNQSSQTKQHNVARKVKLSNSYSQTCQPKLSQTLFCETMPPNNISRNESSVQTDIVLSKKVSKETQFELDTSNGTSTENQTSEAEELSPQKTHSFRFKLNTATKSNSVAVNEPKLIEGKTKYTCNICNKRFPNQGEFRKHQKIHRMCHICKKTFLRIDYAQNHIKNDH